MLCSEEIFNSGGNERTIPGVPQKEGESSAWPGVLEDRSRVGPFLADRRGRHCSAGASNGARCWRGGGAGPRPRAPEAESFGQPESPSSRFGEQAADLRWGRGGVGSSPRGCCGDTWASLGDVPASSGPIPGSQGCCVNPEGTRPGACAPWTSGGMGGAALQPSHGALAHAGAESALSRWENREP